MYDNKFGIFASQAASLFRLEALVSLPDFSFARLERCADMLQLLSGRYLPVYVVPGVARGDQDGAHVLVAALQTEEFLHQAHVLLAGAMFKGVLSRVYPGAYTRVPTRVWLQEPDLVPGYPRV